MFDPEGPSGTEAAEIAAIDGEATVTEGLPISFAGTNLQDVLEGVGRKSLVWAGFMTHMCISSTAGAALVLGYSNTVVDAVCATRDLLRAALLALSDRFALIVRDANAWA